MSYHNIVLNANIDAISTVVIDETTNSELVAITTVLDNNAATMLLTPVEAAILRDELTLWLAHTAHTTDSAIDKETSDDFPL